LGGVIAEPASAEPRPQGYRPFLSPIGDLPFCRLGIAPPGPRVRMAVLILATRPRTLPMLASPKRGERQNPPSAANVGWATFAPTPPRRRRQRRTERQCSAAKISTRLVARTTRESHAYGELPPIFLMIDWTSAAASFQAREISWPLEPTSFSLQLPTILLSISR
jgi:hypothetical protein